MMGFGARYGTGRLKVVWRRFKMGVFSRFMDIINSNINSLLDQAEDPQKMIKLMISEMEDTIIEIKTNCASVIGSQNSYKRRISELEALVERWQQRAELAISKGRDDLAREALLEKKRLSIELNRLREDSARYDAMIAKYKEDLEKLEDKLQSAKAKYKAMREQAAKEAEARRNAGPTYYYSSNGKKSDDPIDRFNDMEERINKMNARRNGEQNSSDVESRFKDLETEQDIEDELNELKKNMK